MAPLLSCSSTEADSQGAPQASCSCETFCPQRAHLSKTSAGLAPAPPARAPAQLADVQPEAEDHQPDPAVGNSSLVFWAEELGPRRARLAKAARGARSRTAAWWPGEQAGMGWGSEDGAALGRGSGRGPHHGDSSVLICPSFLLLPKKPGSGFTSRRSHGISHVSYKCSSA